MAPPWTTERPGPSPEDCRASEATCASAVAQSTALGFPAVSRVFTPHPIQDRTDDEIVTYADVAFDQIVDALTN